MRHYADDVCAYRCRECRKRIEYVRDAVRIPTIHDTFAEGVSCELTPSGKEVEGLVNVAVKTWMYAVQLQMWLPPALFWFDPTYPIYIK